MTNEELESELRKVSGCVTALEFAVETLIVMHPNRGRLMRMWKLMLPDLIDILVDERPEYQAHADQRDAINEELAELTSYIELELPKT